MQIPRMKMSVLKLQFKRYSSVDKFNSSSGAKKLNLTASFAIKKLLELKNAGLMSLKSLVCL
jgi:hypothetical protein